MTTKEYNDWQSIAALGLCPEDENPIFIFNSTYTDLLMDIVNGKIDARDMAKLELRNRGLDIKTGKFIGWRTKTTALK